MVRNDGEVRKATATVLAITLGGRRLWLGLVEDASGS